MHGGERPGVINLTTGIANALIDCCPVVAVGGSSPIGQNGRQVFQEIDQLAIMKPCTKWADRVYNLKRIPEQVNFAFQKAMSGKPGPVYLDFPGDVLYAKIPEEQVDWSLSGRPLLNARPLGDPNKVDALVDAIAEGARSRSSVRQRRDLVAGLARTAGVRREDRHSFLHDAARPRRRARRSCVFVPDDALHGVQDADLIIVVGTRMNYIIGHAAPPRFNGGAKIARIDIDADEIATAPRRVDIGIVGDCKAVLRQLIDASTKRSQSGSFLRMAANAVRRRDGKRQAPGANKPMDETPIHPLRLCDEIKNFMQRDAILVVDGQEILNFGRQSMPTFTPGHRLNSGPFGTMGVGLPFGIGAKLAKPDKQVIVVHGDGSFGLNALELDTAVRHNIPILVVVSLNGGWTADPQRDKPGRNLGYTRFDKMAETLGCYGEYVERPRKSARLWTAPNGRSIAARSRSSTSRPTTAPAPARWRSPNMPLENQFGCHDKAAPRRKHSKFGHHVVDQRFLRSREQIMAALEHGRVGQYY